MDLDRRYRLAAPGYDLLSGEAVYRAGRRLGVAGLDLAPGAVVLDVGCGTGLNFPLLQAAVGPTGRVVGLDASAAMLRQAARRCRREGWTNVDLVLADARSVDPGALVARAGRPAHAALASYALSLMPNWPAAWRTMVAATTAEARLAVVDMARPRAGAAARSLAALACWLGGADLEAHPWTAVEQQCVDVATASAWAGHLQVRSGRALRGRG